MSQIIKNAVNSTPSIPTQFTTEYDSGNGLVATPIANNLYIIGGDSVLATNANYDDAGISTTVSDPEKDTVETYLTNRISVSTITNDNIDKVIFTFPMGTIAGVYTFYGKGQIFDTTTPSGGSFSFNCAFRTDGTTTIELGDGIVTDQFYESALEDFDFTVLAGTGATKNDVIFSVQGVGSLVIGWNLLIEYRRIT